MSDSEFVSYAQNAEDVVLCRAFAGRRGGFFVDVGAGDPVRNSVTKSLVDRLGWRGVNIEPAPEEFARLRAARPDDVNLRVAVGSVPGRSEFFLVRDVPGRSGGIDLSTLDPALAATHRADGWVVDTAEVDVVTLDSVLAAHARPGFELLKLDVEGREADVLRSVDLSAWRPQVLVVEATVPGTRVPSHAEWEPPVLAAGYRLALFDGLNRFYAREGLDDIHAELSIPANAFDRWIPARFST